jgi:thiamine-phosphate pyrophosphorylase
MKLIIMTKPTFFVEEDKILTTLFEEGMESLHLNKPGADPVYSERLLTLLSDEYYKRITVHDHFYLREEFKLRGIHLNNADDMPPATYRGDVSRTCCDIQQLSDVKRHSVYVFLDGVLSSPGMSYDDLMAARRQGLIDKRVYAMGGISLDNMHLCKELGFGGVVVCDDLWEHFDIHRGLDYKDLIAHYRKLHKAAN